MASCSCNGDKPQHPMIHRPFHARAHVGIHGEWFTRQGCARDCAKGLHALLCNGLGGRSARVS
eukprot:421102-Alexandrium_andersonii.AAC.1